jgi:hypothetical protein
MRPYTKNMADFQIGETKRGCGRIPLAFCLRESHMTSSHPLQNSPSSRFLFYVGRIWFLTAAAGQAAFVWMILAHYGRRTLAGDYAG